MKRRWLPSPKGHLPTLYLQEPEDCLPKRHTWMRNQQRFRQWDQITSVRDPRFWWEGRGEELSHTLQVLPLGQSPVLKPRRGDISRAKGRQVERAGSEDGNAIPHQPCQLLAHKRPERQGSQTSSDTEDATPNSDSSLQVKFLPNMHMKYLLKVDHMLGERERFNKYHRTKIIQSIFCV